MFKSHDLGWVKKPKTQPKKFGVPVTGLVKILISEKNPHSISSYLWFSVRECPKIRKICQITKFDMDLEVVMKKSAFLFT
jgi:hypothetical protein